MSPDIEQAMRRYIDLGWNNALKSVSLPPRGVWIEIAPPASPAIAPATAAAATVSPIAGSLTSDK